MSDAADLVEIFREVADLLDLQGERFKPEAYRRAARSLEALTEDLRRVAARGELRSIPGVGEAIAEKIEEYLRDGRIHYLERVRTEVPPGLIEIMHLPGFGPKTARRLWTELGVEGPRELESALAAHRLDGLAGFGPRKIQLLTEALAGATATPQRRPLRVAWETATALVAALRSGAPVDRVEVAGSLRRRRETVGDLDVLATSTAPEKVFEVFSALPMVRAVKMRGPTKETVEYGDGLQVDLRVVEPAAFGAALQYFTGSKDHNVHLRTIARDRGLKVNEYGVFRGEERVAGATEEEVYAALGLPPIPPEIREDRGEIEAAAGGRLPALVAPADLRGNLHVHLSSLGGVEGLPSALAAAGRMGWEYLGVVVRSSETAALPAVARALAGRDPGGPRVYLGVEVEPAAPETAVREAQFRVVNAGAAGPPSGKSPGTKRAPPILLAAHFASAAGAAPDPERLRPWIRWAVEGGGALEVTSEGPVDGLDSAGVRQVVDAGATLHLGPGAASPADWGRVELALGLARRGWATAASVINARRAAELDRTLARVRGSPSS